MIEYRPSIGQFSGYYNINHRDYERFSSGRKPILQESADIPDLTVAEIAQLEYAVRDCLTEWIFVSDKSIVDYKWPSPSFGLDGNYVDRTMNVWTATSRFLESKLLLRLSQLLRDDFALWRIVVRLPRGDEADCTVYPDAIRVGDDILKSDADLTLRKVEWQQAEDQDLAPRAHQINVLSGESPNIYLDKNRGIFQFAVLPGAFGFDASKNVRRTAWFGYRCDDPKDAPHRIEKLIIDGLDIVAGATEIPGHLSGRSGWCVSPWSKANSRLVYFSLDQAIKGNRYKLIGYSTAELRDWRYSGTLADY